MCKIMSTNKICLNSKFLGCKELDSDINDIELGSLLYSIGRKRWRWRRTPLVNLNFQQESFILTFNHHGENTHVCDLRDVTKVSVHPTNDRIVGFVLHDRQSHVQTFMCFKLCRESNMKGEDFKKVYQTMLKLHHPPPKIENVRMVKKQLPQHNRRRQYLSTKVARPKTMQLDRKVTYHKLRTARETYATAASTYSLRNKYSSSSSSPPPLLPKPSPPSQKKIQTHRNGKFVRSRLYQIGAGENQIVSRAFEPAKSGTPLYENLSNFQRNNY